MKPNKRSIELLGVTRSKAKMYEYSIPDEFHIKVSGRPERLLSLTVGILGEFVNQEGQQAKGLKAEVQLNDLLFSAQFFDSFIQTQLDTSINQYLLLLGSSSYYLGDFPGSAMVLARRLGDKCPDFECDGLENLLFELLSNRIDRNNDGESPYSIFIDKIRKDLDVFYNEGLNSREINKTLENLLRFVYANGSARHLLISDVIKAVLLKRIENSSWNSLEKFTDIKISDWAPIIRKGNFIREFWPSQNLLGEKGVFNGKSAVIQMPTSAGKTKSIEIIIRSGFLSKKVKLAVVVAPFRALCAEIRNNLVEAFSGENINVDAISDVMIPDFEAFDIFGIQPIPTILVSTPEKLVYMLRHDPNLAEHIGLIIYDEGHQFDTGLRGVIYELMISSLKRLIPRDIQVVLISAVLSNAKSIGEWLQPGIEVVAGAHLSPTYRTIAFTSWKDYRGRLDFIDVNNLKIEYYVPRVLEQLPLEKLGREKKQKVFPEKDDGKQIALYLGMKLVQNGSVAIFCGTKSTVQGICELAANLEKRNAYKVFPSSYSDLIEVQKLTKLSSLHFGEDSIPSKSSQLGIFAHSTNTPQGLRLAIEYAMQKSLIKFVVCTSTLAQGVNLPIKYLIVTSVYQAGEKIKTRDFHNLIGRAGRSGIHTEGSIIFADPEVYDNRGIYREDYKWVAVRSLLDPKNAEPCVSTLLTVFDPLHSDNQQYIIEANPIGYIDSYINEKGSIIDVAEQIIKSLVSPLFSSENLKKQIVQKISIIAVIESYLMAYSNEKNPSIDEVDVIELAKATLAYQSSKSDVQNDIIELFKKISNHINSHFKIGRKRRMYGKTLFGVKDIQHIEAWTIQNYANLILCVDEEELLSALWPIIVSKITNATFRKIMPQNAILSIAKEWISGATYYNLLVNFISTKAYIKAGKQERKPKLETIIELCDNTFAFEATLVVAAIREVIIYNYNDEQSEKVIELINRCQKSLKYGLNSELAVAFYEMGFSDRIVAQSLVDLNKAIQPVKAKVLEALSANKSYLRLLNSYPSYYTNVYNEVLSNTN